jgi:diguanylate cyclase (GGDEF)-like protein/PAS domain S-box-containing protein
MKTQALRRVVSAIGLCAAVTATIALPAGYSAVEYTHSAEDMQFRAQLNAQSVAKYVYSNGTLWQYQRSLIKELLEQTDRGGDVIRKRVVDLRGRIVLDEGGPVAWPTMTSSAPIVVAGQKVGDAEVSTSLQPLLQTTGVVALFSLLLGYGMYRAGRAFPLRLLDETLGALEGTNRRFDAALSNMAQGLCIFDSEQRLVVWNRRFLDIFGLTPDDVRLGMPLRECIECALGRSEMFHDSAEAIIAEKQRAWSEGKESVALRHLTDGRVISVTEKPLATGGWLSSYEDITERRRAEATIAHMARHDALTDLPNRLLLGDQIEQALDGLRDGEKLAVLCLDLDHFKAVNDTLGHPIGDALLKAVGERLRQSVGEQDTVARLGGDEFAIVQAEATQQPDDSASLAGRLVEVLSAPYEVDGHQVVVGVSVGIAIAPADGNDRDQLLKNADMALYRAKVEGRSTYRFFEAEMDARAQARRVLELDLRAAIKNGEFELHYQPIVDVSTGQVIAFEALLRWNHPNRGMVAPLDFIPVAEETGLIGPIGEWVLRQACREALRWPDHIGVAVNLSPVQFKNRQLVQTVISALTASGLAPARLELEITESVLLQDSEGTLATLHNLRSFGVRISMDDFGTGYSSLSYLRSFPFDKIKIDRSFIQDLATRRDCMAIVRAVTGLGTSLGIATTAEGVETQSQLDSLRAEGCTEVQGYFFSAPKPAGEIQRLLRDMKVRVAA